MANGDGNNPGADTQQILAAIQKMLSGVGQATGQGQGPATGSPIVSPQRLGPTPQSTISFNPGGASNPAIQTSQARPTPTVPQTGSQSIGNFATRKESLNAGLVSLGNSLTGLFSAAEQKVQAKKSALAENYMLQINSLLASGDPNDKKKAELILEDPKILKTLKTGLEYVPLQEEVPPEARGVQSAIQKTTGQQQGQQQQQRPQMRPVLPQPSQQAQLQSAMQNALLQKIKQDPASAISMLGQSQLSSAEQHADEFYKAGLGLTPAEIGKLSTSEKLQGMKTYEAATVAAIKGEIDMYKAGVGYSGKVDSATILANARKYVADTVKSTADKKNNNKPNASAAGAKVYEDYAKKYLDIIKGGKGPDGKPLTPEQTQQYQQKADSYQKQADDYLQQQGDEELIKDFMKATQDDDATDPDDK